MDVLGEINEHVPLYALKEVREVLHGFIAKVPAQTLVVDKVMSSGDLGQAILDHIDPPIVVFRSLRIHRLTTMDAHEQPTQGVFQK